MKLFGHTFVCLAVSFCVFVSYINAQEAVKSFEVNIGIIEFSPDWHKRFTFRWEGHEEIFDMSLNAYSSGSSSRGPGLQDLKDTGVKMTSGLICEFGKQLPEKSLEKFMELHPKEKALALLFEGETGEKLEIKLEGGTSVCRVKLQFYGHDLFLWKNLPEKPENKAKPDSNAKDEAKAKIEK